MSFPKYPAYKDSGVEWLGEVPEHWEVRPIKALAMLKGGAGFPDAEQGRENEELYFYKVAALGQADAKGILQPPPDSISRDSAMRLGAFVFPAGSLTFAKVGAALLLARIRQLSAPSCLDNNMMGMLVNKENDTRFVLFAMSLVRFDLIANPGAVPSLNASQIGNFQLALPPRAEQTAIATFLDHETAKIDTLVAEQEKLITLLQEKRRTVISHAVTKGLNPYVPMKDSGVEWLGKVPEHWSVQRIKHIVATMEQGWSPQCEGFPVQAEDEWGVLKVGCVNGGVFRPEENKTLPSELEPIPELGIKAGDLLISRANTRELVGSAAIALQNYPRLLLCDKIYRVRLLPHACEPVFLALYLGSDRVRGQIELAATGASSSMLNIGQSTILEMDFVVPPLEEQHEILRVVADDVSRIDALTIEANSAIVLLQERRTALISAAVTGQIDVRNWPVSESA